MDQLEILASIDAPVAEAATSSKFYSKGQREVSTFKGWTPVPNSSRRLHPDDMRDVEYIRVFEGADGSKYCKVYLKDGYILKGSFSLDKFCKAEAGDFIIPRTFHSVDYKDAEGKIHTKWKGVVQL